jgi:basic membrane protein A
MKNMKKAAAALLALLLLAAMMAGCQPKAEEPATSEDAAKDVKIALISNQRSGDLGPVDAMIAGAKRVEEEFGVTVKTLESTDAAAYEEDIRAMAKEGYNLIITTFPPMTEATKAVAKDYPDVKFAAIFQYINVDGQTVENVWDTEYRGEECTYVLGAMAATLSENNMIGYISGDESSGVCEAANGYMRGAKAANPDITVEFMSVDNYEDPAKAKEIANAMIAKGVDVLQTDAGNSQVGVIEAAKEAGVYVAGDVSNNFDLCPNGFFSYLGIDFGENVYQACKYFIEGNFPGGTHGIMNIASNTYFINFEVLEKLKANLPDKADKIDAARKMGEEVIAKIKSGELVIEQDLEMPSWERIKAE